MRLIETNGDYWRLMRERLLETHETHERLLGTHETQRETRDYWDS